MKSHPKDPEAYRQLWQDMFRYFTEERKLHNLLWVYSPNFGGSNTSSWNRSVDWAYPGDAYVDIVAGTSYSDSLDFPYYQSLMQFGKPLGLAEYSPKTANGKLDTRLYEARLKEDYPAVAYWVSWHSWPEESWSLVSNLHSRELLESDFILTRDELPCFDL